MVDSVDGNKTSSNYKELFGLTRNRGAESNKTRHRTSLSLSLSSFNSVRSSVQQFRGLASIWLVEALSTSSRDGHEGLDNRKDAGLIISRTKNPRQERVDPLEYFSENFPVWPWIDRGGDGKKGLETRRGKSSLNRNRFGNWFIENSRGLLATEVGGSWFLRIRRNVTDPIFFGLSTLVCREAVFSLFVLFWQSFHPSFFLSSKRTTRSGSRG